MKRAVMALSGGMDSSALLLHLLAGGHRVTCLSFDYGQQHRLELRQAEALVQHLIDHQHDVVHQTVDLSSAMGLFSSHLLASGDAIPEGHYEEEAMKSTVVPNRNAIFASLLYGTALSIANDTGDDVAVALGVHSGDHAIYPDCRPEFYDALGEAFRIGNWGAERVSFTLPYLDMDKAGILLDAEVTTEALGLNFDDVFERTLTTYDPTPDGKSHGKTGSDIERILAFHAVGRRDPFPYVAGWDAVLAHALGEDRRHRAKALADRLTPLQWHVTQEAGTERAFTGEFWNASDPGTYACICCGKALFDHTSKFSSGCGWPSFHTERGHARIHRLVDRTHGMVRTEVRCSTCDAHLGHVFDDGPREHGGERYCINSASLTFIPQEEAA
jgi:7-cyano-7-deazaguanine synthase